MRPRKMQSPLCPPNTAFEKNFSDYFNYAGRHFLIDGNKFSDWSDVFGTPAGSAVTDANALLRLFRLYFATFGVPEEISSDGIPEFTAFVTQDFMHKWNIKHCFSSVYFPQFNELQLKPLIDFSCPILALRGISTIIRSCALLQLRNNGS